MATVTAFRTDPKGRPREVTEIRTRTGIRIFMIPVETYPGHINNVYLIDHPNRPILVDVGSGLATTDRDLDLGLAQARSRFGPRATITDVAEVVITHAHADHFGNAHRFHRLGVPIAVHEADAHVLARFDERARLATSNLETFLLRSGLDRVRTDRFLALYRSGKPHFPDLEPDRRLGEGDVVGSGWPVLHVPGHCAGQICIAVDDVVLVADHLLARTTPALSPEWLAPGCGLTHYLSSLEKLRAFGRFDLALGGHEAPMPDVSARIAEVKAHHERRLRMVLEFCRPGPLTVAEISRRLFGPQRGYSVLLALGEAAAHIEYLHPRGHLAVANPDEVAANTLAAPRFLACGVPTAPLIESRPVPALDDSPTKP
jgi:glyoxylase-like metal-dependent hydrolase (beta-lactamase superfamily II)